MMPSNGRPRIGSIGANGETNSCPRCRAAPTARVASGMMPTSRLADPETEAVPRSSLSPSRFAISPSRCPPEPPVSSRNWNGPMELTVAGKNGMPPRTASKWNSEIGRLPDRVRDSPEPEIIARAATAARTSRFISSPVPRHSTPMTRMDAATSGGRRP